MDKLGSLDLPDPHYRPRQADIGLETFHLPIAGTRISSFAIGPAASSASAPRHTARVNDQLMTQIAEAAVHLADTTGSGS